MARLKIYRLGLYMQIPTLPRLAWYLENERVEAVQVWFHDRGWFECREQGRSVGRERVILDFFASLFEMRCTPACCGTSRAQSSTMFDQCSVVEVRCVVECTVVYDEEDVLLSPQRVPLS